MATRDPKPCARCGRSIEWRKKWARDWDEVRYCSNACRSKKLTSVDRALETSILELLSKRASGATICPSEAARAVSADLEPAGDEAWRTLMEPARSAARRLVVAGEIEITQKGRVVDPSTAKGPIRLRRSR